MAKPPRIPYQPVEDIPNLHKAKISAPDSDKLMRELLNSTRFALHNSSNLKKPSDFKKPIAEILINQLFMFSITHYSIREVIAAAERHKQYSLVGDALSLAREQVEKVFIVASLLDNPNRNFRQYLRSSWKTEYEKFLLEKEEHRENERFKEFLSDTTPKRLESMRRNQFVKSKKDVLVSKLAVRVLKFSWDNPGAKNAPFLKKGTVYNYVKEYFDFATPGRSARKVADPALRAFLYRWHKEYVSLSQYTHVTVRKLMFANMVRQKDMSSQERIQEYGVESAIRAINTSYTAAAAACVLVLNGVTNHYGAKEEAKQFWGQLIGFSLFSKALWNMYIKDVI
jgi:hypothetical protein